jgi:hypothetical protein
MGRAGGAKDDPFIEHDLDAMRRVRDVQLA